MYHLVPSEYLKACRSSAHYLPADFAREGFIHCTHGEYVLSTKANKYYGKLQDELCVLVIERERVKSPVRYDDKEKMFPHIYGPLNWDAVVRELKMVRDRRGDWIFPILRTD